MKTFITALVLWVVALAMNGFLVFDAAHAAPRHQGAIVTVPTAAGIPITVARDLVYRFQGFIADLVAGGYHPRHIGSFATHGHVKNSRHYAGAALDIDQHGYGLTSARMHHAGALIAKWGLRDGCSFRDCGHVDDGVSIRRVSRWHRVRLWERRHRHA
jgi:hypothetical protein